MIQIFKATGLHFINSKTFEKGAALAYYTVFSILPMIVITISLLGMVFGKDAVSGEVYEQLKEALGENASLQIQNTIKNQHIQQNSLLTSLIGLATLMLSATGMFNQIHSSFNGIWSIKAKPKSSIVRYLTLHITSFFLLIFLFFILLMSTVVTSFLVKYSSALQNNYKLFYIYEHVISFSVLLLIFSLIFKFLGDAIISWKAVFIGAVFTSLLFILGKIGIGKYIGHSHISSTFGSASVLAVLMLWVYYISQILFLGASFIKVISERLGEEIVPSNNGVLVVQNELSENKK